MASKFMTGDEIASATLEWGVLRFISSPSSTGAKNLTIIEGVINHGMGHNFHKHMNQEEVLFVIYGSVEQWVDQEMRILGPGEAVYLQPGVVHASFNAGDGEAKVIAIFGPSVGDGGLEVVEMADQAPWNALRAKADA